MIRRVVTFAALSIVTSLGAAAGAAAERRPTLTVAAVLARTALTPAQARTLTAEVAAIWTPAGVRIDWRHDLPPAGADADLVLRVHLQPHLPIGGSDAPQPLGAVLRVAGRVQPVVFLSRAAVEGLLDEAGIWRIDGRFDLYFARLLGRVVAHELGHVLLDSPGHRLDGLMRERFDADDVLAPHRGRYRLTRDDLARLRSRAMVARVHDPGRAGDGGPK